MMAAGSADESAASVINEWLEPFSVHDLDPDSIPTSLLEQTRLRESVVRPLSRRENSIVAKDDSRH